MYCFVLHCAVFTQGVVGVDVYAAPGKPKVRVLLLPYDARATTELYLVLGIIARLL